MLEPFTGEIIACIQGTQAAINAGVGHLVVETDALEVVRAVLSNEYDLSSATHLVAELKSLLTWNFISWRIQQRPRSCNRVAHELASWGSLCDSDEDQTVVTIPENLRLVIADESAVYG